VQHSVKELRTVGIAPDIILCRTDRFLPKNVKAKIALFCNVDQGSVIGAPDVETIYEVPLVFHGEGLDERIVEKLNIFTGSPNLTRWKRMVSTIKNPKETVEVAMVGKYVDLTDSYKSLNEALTHGGFASDVRVVRRWIEAEELESANADVKLAGVDGILVPGGFGSRGTGGMVAAAEYARRTGTPFFGICYGFQWAVTEYARNVCGLAGASSTEVDPDTEHKVIYKLQDLLGVDDMGGTMRVVS
jgi:CTP synthase